MKIRISNVKYYVNRGSLLKFIIFIQIYLYKNKNLHSYCIFLGKI